MQEQSFWKNILTSNVNSKKGDIIMAKDQMSDIQENKVGSQVQQLVYSEGVSSINCERQTDGKWTITVVSEGK